MDELSRHDFVRLYLYLFSSSLGVVLSEISTCLFTDKTDTSLYKAQKETESIARTLCKQTNK